MEDGERDLTAEEQACQEAERSLEAEWRELGEQWVRGEFRRMPPVSVQVQRLEARVISALEQSVAGARKGDWATYWQGMEASKNAMRALEDISRRVHEAWEWKT